MNEELDINEQYEKIFGKEIRPNVFSPDDEEYNSLRQDIRDAKREFNPNKKLPFDGIKIQSYEDFRRDEIVQEAAKTGNRVFFIKKYKGGKLIAYAAAYFNIRNNMFFVLRESFCHETEYFRHLTNSIYITKRFAFRSSFVAKEEFLQLKETKVFDSASVAASYFLGKKTTFREWRDERGKTLDAYFVKYKSESINDSEDKTFPDYVEPKPEPVREVMNGSITELIGKPITQPKPKNQTQPQTQSPIIDILNSLPGNNSRHLFYLKEDGLCNASGYYDPETNYFYICKDSLVAIREEEEYCNTTSSQARKRFIDQACELQLLNIFYYRVKKDAKCRTASAAACYVLGRTATYSLWKDANGKYLKDFYPGRFFVGGENVPTKAEQKTQTQSSLRMFFLKRDTDPERMCNVSGYYDITTQKFIVQAGSLFCLGSAISYEYTQAGIARRTFLNKYCSKEKTGYRLKKDYIFDAPSTAASYALGRSANGWTEFKDKNRITLDSVYR